jgi:hypothetical protein
MKEFGLQGNDSFNSATVTANTAYCMKLRGVRRVRRRRRVRRVRRRRRRKRRRRGRRRRINVMATKTAVIMKDKERKKKK